MPEVSSGWCKIEHVFEGWSDLRVLSGVQGSYRQIAAAMAASLAGIAELLDRRTAEELDAALHVRSVITAFDRTAVEVGAALALPSPKARELVRQADALHTRLPGLGALLAAGEVDYDTVAMVLDRTDLVHEDVMPQLEAALLERVRGWACFSRKQLRDAVDALVKEVDADAVKQRRTRAYDQRRVSVAAGADGMAVVRGTMSAEAGAALDTRLTAIAKKVCACDPRSLVQRRADAFKALTLGEPFGCMCGRNDCPDAVAATPVAATPAAPPQQSLPMGRQVVLNVIASAETVTGLGNAAGYLLGYGVIDAELVRELARDATRRLVEAPRFEERQALTYRPSDALARFIRARDLTCRFPGCTVPATRCDIDHTTPFDHEDPAAGGWTVPWNLACYCREHHRHKTFDTGWRDQQLVDGTIIWTAPTGHEYRTVPAGVGLFPGLGRARNSAERRRVAAARQRLHRHRDASTYNRYRNQQARDEVRNRRWRNGFRGRYLLFKGEFAHNAPSRSPFGRFVNDPFEPESLPPDWHPPPQDRADPDEPPPF
ncbi:13E12 repeat family protein [Mycolicibacterium gilvum]|uniref:13E12 repeat family protein n=1 Tax=Mycolicibacterium gilvum TaxID=1804 RepID=A0A378SUC4_9MYCO|nr:13E12 repeat family protein [Mycolicibacterium gilvum]